MRSYLKVGLFGLILVLILAACTGEGEETTTTTTSPPPSSTTTTTAPAMEPEVEIPFLTLWEDSAHADATAEAFTHWNEDDPPVVPASCAKCHSATGFEDFLGVDGSAFGAVDADQPVGTVITCTACHNDATLEMDSVVMPSGVELTGLGREARCMQCHQGRAWKGTVDEAVAGIDEDTVSEDLGFINIHYFAAAATKYGTVAKGGYEYDGKTYDSFFTHVEGYTSCIDCHDSHSLEVKVDECTTCHTDVATVEDLRDIRMPGSLVDYDGDGDMSEGIAGEIEGVQTKLYAAIQAYADEKSGTPIVYDPHAYPYFFIDTNANGDVDEGEAAFPNKYNAWTPRLLKAAYNYQVSIKDPGGYAHGGKYLIQLLVDSTEDLNSVLSSPVALEGVHRIDHGHFAGSEEAFRHWDEDGAVPASCSKCHSDAGLPLFLSQGVTISQPPANGLLCSTCHSDLSTWERYEAGSVTFPSGAVIDSGDATMNLCMTCHQGRSSTGTVDAATAGIGNDTVSDSLGFINIHYFAAGATIFGSEVQGAYQYPGKSYVGRFEHVSSFNTCTSCHDAHALEVKVDNCSMCHDGVVTEEDLHAIRVSETDFDGDGDATEGIAGEIDTMRDVLYAAIQAYAAKTAGADPIVYAPHSYPYFFIDDGNGTVDPGEAIYPNKYATWTPRLLRAAYNYQYAMKDPGAFAHNAKYVIQVLYDSIADLGGSTAGMTRP